jgi:hypothetical protein
LELGRLAQALVAGSTSPAAPEAVAPVGRAVMDVQNLRERPPFSDTLAGFNSQPFVDIVHGGALARAIVDTVREPLLILDKDLRVVTASYSFYLTFGMRPQDVEDHKVYALGNGQWNTPELRLLLENISPQHAMMEAYEVEQDFSGIGLRTLLLNARKAVNEKTFHTTILLAIEDITEQRAMKRESGCQCSLKKDADLSPLCLSF